MGKKGSWFSAIKRVFTHGSKDKLVNEAEKKTGKEKKKGRGILKHGETKSFLPLFREPSSIEKILGEVDKQKLLIRPPTPSEQPNASLFHARPASPRVTSPRVISPRVASPRITSPRGASPRVASPRGASPRVASPPPPPPPPKVVRRKPEISYRPEPTLRYRNLSATKIQAAYRGYRARRSFKALKGLVRLQGVVRGQNVKRQTANAMKQMQLLVRVQTQIQSRRIQMLESQHQTYKNDKEVESSLGKWTVNQLSEAGDNGHWDDSFITKEEREARLQRKVEAAIKRERAMAYAYSNKLWKANPKSAQATDIRSGGFPWWWNWLERQLPATDASDSRPVKNFRFTPPRLTPQHKPSPRPQTSGCYKPNHFGFDHLEPASTTPRSSKSTLPARTRNPFTPSRTPPSAVTTPNLMKYSKPRASHASASGSTVYDMPLKDDDSLVSCPPFSVPNYMAPTVSAKAKVRPTSNPKERFPGTPGSESSRRRFSFPLTPNMGSFKWNNKGSSKDSVTSQGMVIEKHKSPRSIGEFSVDSTISMPATVGRKPFNRFV